MLTSMSSMWFYVYCVLVCYITRGPELWLAHKLNACREGMLEYKRQRATAMMAVGPTEKLVAELCPSCRSQVLFYFVLATGEDVNGLVPLQELPLKTRGRYVVGTSGQRAWDSAQTDSCWAGRNSSSEVMLACVNWYGTSQRWDIAIDWCRFLFFWHHVSLFCGHWSPSFEATGEQWLGQAADVPVGLQELGMTWHVAGADLPHLRGLWTWTSTVCDCPSVWPRTETNFFKTSFCKETMAFCPFSQEMVLEKTSIPRPEAGHHWSENGRWHPFLGDAGC